jgi:hypothetical protein
MILEGKVIKCLGIKEGTSQAGREWKLASYLIDTTTNEQYPKQVVVEVFGEDRINELSIIPDEQVKLNVEAESREFNGKWYTSVRAWGRAEDDTDAQPETQVVQTAQPETQVVPEYDSTQMPF